MDDLEISALDRAFECLPKNPRETVRLARAMGDVLEQAAKAYMERLQPSKPPLQPWEMENELKALAKAARELKERIEEIHPAILCLVQGVSDGSRFVSPVREMPFGTWDEIVSSADPYSWFQLQRCTFDEDGVPDLEEPWWGHDGMRPQELEALALFFEGLQSHAAQRKQTPNGFRAAQPTPQEKLISIVHRMVLGMEQPEAHTLQIAKKIHEWAANEVLGEQWGKSTLESIKRREKENPIPF